MIKCNKDINFLEWFPLHISEFSDEITSELKHMYIDDISSLTESTHHILIYNINLIYIAFLRYGLGSKTIDLSYIVVDKTMQRNGIGFELSCFAIDEGLKRGCTHVAAGVSNAAIRLIENLKTKYPEVSFEHISYSESNSDMR